MLTEAHDRPSPRLHTDTSEAHRARIVLTCGTSPPQGRHHAPRLPPSQPRPRRASTLGRPSATSRDSARRVAGSIFVTLESSSLVKGDQGKMRRTSRLLQQGPLSSALDGCSSLVRRSSVFTTANSSLREAINDFFWVKPRPERPTEFSHQVHVENKLGCTEYCHESAAKGRSRDYRAWTSGSA